MARHSRGDLQQMQSLPLEAKIRMTEQRIRGWVDAWKRWKIVNQKTGKVRYVTDTEEPSEKGHWVKDEKDTLRLIKGTQLKPFEYVDDWETEKAYVSFSGGKDSTVLLDIARKLYPNIEAVFVNTGLEYPSVREFATKQENVTTLKPSMIFREVICKYGYPVISKDVALKVYRIACNKNSAYRHFFDGSQSTSIYDCSRYDYLLHSPFRISHMCCDIMKKEVTKEYEGTSGQKPIIGTMAEESRLRLQRWIQNGCNAFDIKRPASNPMSFWTEQDVLKYIHDNDIDIADAYGSVIFNKNKQEYYTTGCKRTGCIFCLFGITQDKGRIADLQIQEPKLADYVLRGGEFGEDGYWKPNNTGLGYWFVIEWLNIHGLDIKIYKDIDYPELYGNQRTKEILLKEKIKVKMKQTEVADDSSN